MCLWPSSSGLYVREFFTNKALKAGKFCTEFSVHALDIKEHALENQGVGRL
jgi:hypothetical protein